MRSNYTTPGLWTIALVALVLWSGLVVHMATCWTCWSSDHFVWKLCVREPNAKGTVGEEYSVPGLSGCALWWKCARPPAVRVQDVRTELYVVWSVLWIYMQAATTSWKNRGIYSSCYGTSTTVINWLKETCLWQYQQKYLRFVTLFSVDAGDQT